MALTVPLLAAPVILVLLVGDPWPGIDAIQLGATEALQGLLGAIGWVVWAQYAACVVSETVGLIRDREPVSVGPAAQRRAVRLLVTVALLGSSAVSVAGPMSAWASSGGSDAHARAGTAHATAIHQGQAAATVRAPSKKVVTVAKGDTLWGLAEEHLGDGARWREIARANHERLMPDGSRFTTARDIRPGWELMLPERPSAADAGGRSHDRATIRVRPGDSLSSLAAQHLGGPEHWRELYRINRAIIGADPDLLLPGQELRLVEQVKTPPATDAGEGRTSEAAPTASSEPAPQVPVETLPESQAEAQTTEADHFELGQPDEASSADDAVADPEDAVPVTAATPWRAIFATGSSLAAGLVLLIAAGRRRQMAACDRGQVPHPAPERLRPVERAIHEAGTGAMDDATFIDTGLRQLSLSLHETRGPLPEVGAAVLGPDFLELKLVGISDDDPPAPWERGDDETWRLPRDASLQDEAGDHPAPYPALVSTGLDADGRLWLLDLEAHGGGGLPDGDILRHWVAELASAPWASSTELLIADEKLAGLRSINPERIRLVEPELVARRVAALQRDAVGRFTTLLGLRRDGIAEDATGPVVVLGASASVPPCGNERDRGVVLGPDRRCLVEGAGEKVLVLDWDVELAPFRLPAESAAAVADLMDDLEDETSVPIAAPESRPMDEQMRQDWADWHDPDCRRPKIRVLGPVDVMAAGGSREGIRNVASTIEFIIYLAFRERGVTKDRAAEDLGWSPATVQNRARDARRMMGLREDGGEWLPDAATTESARVRGVPTYELRADVLVDAMLFEALRDSGVPREALVAGEPFSDLRAGGYGWLLEGERHDLRLQSMLRDFAEWPVSGA